MKTYTISFKGFISNYLGLPKSIYILFIARIINRIGGFVHTFLALFLSSYLDMNATQIGGYVLKAGIAGFVGAYIGGKISDRFSRKKIYLSAQFIAAVLFIPCGFFVKSHLIWIPNLLIMSSFFSSVVRPVSNAMVADIVDKEDRKRAFSLLYLGINVGVAIGPIIAALLLENYLAWFFWGDAITTFIATILVAVYVDERIVTKEEMDAIEEDNPEKNVEGSPIVALLKRPMILIFMVFAIMNSMMYAQTNFAFPLLLKELFGEVDGVTLYAKLMMLNAVIVLVLTSAIHYLTQNIRPIVNIAIASFLYAVGMGMMAVIDSTALFIVSIVIWTIGEIQSVTNHNVFLISQTPINLRGSFGAITSIVFSLGFIISPGIAGKIIDIKGQSFLWTIVFVMGIISTIGFIGLAFFEKQQNKTQENIMREIA